MGLGFLSVGKYFLINNGPYASDFDMPKRFEYLQEEPIDLFRGTNIFFYPGSARPRFCRQGVAYDEIVPSHLFLTHFLPEGTKNDRDNSFCSLILGGNGIWGDLTSLSREEIDYWKENLDVYKSVRDYIVTVPVRRKGIIGSSPEIYEKVNPENACGYVAFFTQREEVFSWVTPPLQTVPREIRGAESYQIFEDGRIRISVSLEKNGAGTVFLLNG